MPGWKAEGQATVEHIKTEVKNVIGVIEGQGELADETVIVADQGTIFLGGPPLVKAATGETISAEDLGGADVHAKLSGVADHYAENDAHALQLARACVSRLNWQKRGRLKLQEPKPPRLDPAELSEKTGYTLKLRDFPTLEHVIRFVRERAASAPRTPDMVPDGPRP